MPILFDLDGVFYRGDQVIPGAAAVADWARREGIAHLFVTNTTSRPRHSLVSKLAAFGIETDEQHILTPPVAALQWCRQHLPDRAVALYVTDDTRDEFATLPRHDGPVGAVIVGDLARAWTFDLLNDAFRLLMQPQRPQLLALGMTRYWQTADGLQLDVGAFVSALAFAAGVEPLVLGKPAHAFYDAALARLGADPGETVMIGDDIHGDIAGALDAGLHAVLVRTGKFRDSDLQIGITPTAVLDSVCELPQWYAATRA